MDKHRSYVTIRHAGRRFPSRNFTASGTPRQVERVIRSVVGTAAPSHLIRLPNSTIAKSPPA